MNAFAHLLDGFATALSLKNLFLCFVGCLWGTAVGVLPGLGPMAGMALLLPLTFSLDPTGGIIMLAGIFYGAMYGGSTTSILLGIPGEAASIVTCIDGHKMAKKGRAGAALTIAAVGSFVGGSVSILGLMLFAPNLAELMLTVGPGAEAVLMATALLVVAAVSNGPPIKTFTMIVLGLAIGTVGLDGQTAAQRFMFGHLELADGLSFVALAIGLFGLSELMNSLGEGVTERPKTPTLREMIPTRQEASESVGPTLRGSGIGFVFGAIPGVSHIVSTFVSYAVEKKLSKHPEQFGEGAVAGLAGPETANNATTGSSMIPLLVLGIPAIPSTAILLSALQNHGVQPGPLLLVEHPEIFWGLIASMYIGNLILVFLNLPMVGLFVRLLRTPMYLLAPLVVMVCAIGVYSVRAEPLDLAVMVVAGAVGYLLRRFGYDVAPLLLAVVLGDRMESGIRTALSISAGDYMIFFKGPASQTFIALFATIVLVRIVTGLMRIGQAKK
jgi:putative tricarboxylic transport membrane protein